MNILMIGDIIGHPGRKIVKELLPGLKEEFKLDLVVANVENLAGGFGVTRDTLGELKKAGIDVFTSGNHIWDKKDVSGLWTEFPTLLRPANYPSINEGRGRVVVTCPGGDKVGIINLQGRVFMPPIDDPFPVSLSEVEAVKAQGATTILVDFHAEATSEKVAMAHYLDGKVSTVVGTHTHVPTADARVSVAGTAALTDLGLTGPYDSVIGMEKEGVLQKFTTGLPIRYQVAKGDLQLWGLLVEINAATGKALSCKQICRKA